MNQKEAYEYGKGVGFDIGVNNISNFESSEKERYMNECLETECDHFRQFSPFEFVAKEFNESANPDATWEKYENGVAVGLRKAWREWYGRK